VKEKRRYRRMRVGSGDGSTEEGKMAAPSSATTYVIRRLQPTRSAE
jgi:hypothetical protein